MVESGAIATGAEAAHALPTPRPVSPPRINAVERKNRVFSGGRLTTPAGGCPAPRTAAEAVPEGLEAAAAP